MSGLGLKESMELVEERRHLHEQKHEVRMRLTCLGNAEAG